ncbi:MAG: hypothetical protein HUU38_30495, partial [Anaerolineales bacterium]|nr:hypothetical protein [Anaerolineales bacterium]
LPPPTPAATDPARPGYPAPTENPQAGYPAPTESAPPEESTPTQPTAQPITQPTTPTGSSLIGLPPLTAANASVVTLLQSLSLFQDARITWSQDGTQFAVFHPFSSGEIRLYALASGTPALIEIDGHPLSVNGVAFSPDGTQLASTGQDGTLRIWDTATGNQLFNQIITFQSATFADSVEFSPDGTKVALFVSPESALYLYNFPLANTPPTILAWTEHAAPVVSVYPAPDWQTFAWVGRGTLVWMNADGTFRGEQVSHEDFIMNVLYAPDSTRLFIQTAQTINNTSAGVVIVYDVQTGQPLQTLAHPDFVTASALSPDTATLAASSANTVTLWDWATGTEKLSISTPNLAQTLAFSPDGSLLAGTFNGGVIQVWDVATGQVLATLQPGGELFGVRFVMGGTVLAAMQYDGTVQFLGVAPE